MAILSNLSNLGVASHRKIKTLGYFRLRSSALQIQHTTGKNQYGQAQNEDCSESDSWSQTEYPQRAEFIDELLEQKCRKESMSVHEVIFLFNT